VENARVRYDFGLLRPCGEIRRNEAGGDFVQCDRNCKRDG
jgi:hypothetical protein